MATAHSQAAATDEVLVDTATGVATTTATAASAVGPSAVDALGLIAVDADDKQSGSSSNKRRFFPRVKHLMTREWEPVSFHE